MSLDIWSILIIVIFSQGIFLLFTLFFNQQFRKNPSNHYLMAVVLVLIWFLAEFFTIRNKIDVGLSLFYGTRYGSWFLLGPLTYFYFKSITTLDWKIKKTHVWHFLPFVVFVIVIPLISYRALNDRQIDYGMLSAFDHREKVLSGIQWMYSGVFIVQFAHLAYFLIRNSKLAQAYTNSLRNEYATINAQVIWLKRFNLVLITLLILTAIFLYILLITDIYRRHLDYIYVLPIGILFYFISYKFIGTSWQKVAKEETQNKYAGSSLDIAVVRDYAKKLEMMMKQDKLYLNPKLRLGLLAENLEIPKHHLSQVINQEFTLSFFDYINRHRVEEAKTILAKNTDLKLLHVAFDSGFNNKTSFVNAFKKFEGHTPSQYRTKVLG